MTNTNHQTTIPGLAAWIHQCNIDAGWWDGPRTNEGCGLKIALIHSEVSETLEGLRKGQPDKHLPHRSAEEVEAADTLIRLLDYCCARGLDIEGAMFEKMAYNAERADHKPENRMKSGGKKF